jgi:hypothetical protein
MKRKPPTLREELDAALLRILELEGVEYDREKVKRVEAGYVRSLFECDHYPVAVALGGTNHPSNLRHRLVAEHRLKTAKRDNPEIAKSVRLSKAHDEFMARVLAIKNGEPLGETRGRKSKFASRPFDKTWVRKMSGKAVKREEKA